MIKFDAVSENGSLGTATWAHTCSGSGRLLVVGVVSDHTGGGVSGITYNGVAMTGLYSVEGDIYFYTFYLANPAPGTHDIVVAGGYNISCVAASYMGADTTDPTEDPPYTHGGTTDANCNHTSTPSSGGHWAFSIFAGKFVTTEVGTQRIANTDHNYDLYIADTNEAVTLTINWNCTTMDAHINVMAVINPTTSGIPAALSPYYVF